MSNATHVAKIEETVARQRAFFQTGATRPVAVRVAALKRLKKESPTLRGICVSWD